MQVLKLKPKECYRGKYLKIAHIAIRWERKNLAAIIVFHTTRQRADTRAAGIKLFGENIDTIKKMLEEMAELYPVRENMTVYIPESEQEGELWSCYDKGKC